jgi:hypothetical protein
MQLQPANLNVRYSSSLLLTVGVWGLAAGIGMLASARRAQATSSVPVEVRIIYAHNQDKVVDPRIAAMVKTLPPLHFTGYQLKDQTTFNLGPGSSGKMRLPNRAWLTLAALDLHDDQLRLGLEIKELKFKTTVSVGRGATIAIGGPAYEAGTLIIAVTHKAKA